MGNHFLAIVYFCIAGCISRMSFFVFCWSLTDLTNAQCIPAPLATPIPVSDDPPIPSLSPIVPQETPESPSQGPSGRVQYSVPVSEHMGECVMTEDLDSLLENIPKGAEVSVVSQIKDSGGGLQGRVRHWLCFRVCQSICYSCSCTDIIEHLITNQNPEVYKRFYGLVKFILHLQSFSSTTNTLKQLNPSFFAF